MQLPVKFTGNEPPGAYAVVYLQAGAVKAIWTIDLLPNSNPQCVALNGMGAGTNVSCLNYGVRQSAGSGFACNCAATNGYFGSRCQYGCGTNMLLTLPVSAVY